MQKSFISSAIKILSRKDPSKIFHRNLSISQFLFKKENTEDEKLKVYYELDTQDSSQEDVHLNPFEHRKWLNSPVIGHYSQDKKFLNVCVLGLPNVGKSTLVNQIIGFNACAHSSKPHTTRKLSEAVLTENETQIVFRDTPGVVKPDEVKKFHLENSLVQHPIIGVNSSDLIIVIHDMSNRYTREAIDKSILKLLCYHAVNVPTILVLNKTDLLDQGKHTLFRLIEKLTCGYLEGEKQIHGKNQKDSNPANSLDTYLKRKLKEQKKDKSNDKSEPYKNIVKISSYEDFIDVLKSQTINENLVNQLTNGLVGWPIFKEVFTVSALKNWGVEDLKEYILSKAKKANGNIIQT